MPGHSIYHAMLASPLGDMVLSATETHLTGLYFTDQKDCPSVPGRQAPRSDSLDPTSGSAHGQALRRFKVGQPQPLSAQLPGLEPESGDFFDDLLGGVVYGSGHSSVSTATGAASVAGKPRAGQTGPADRPAELRCLQAQTPAAAQAIFSRVQSELRDYFSGEPMAFGTPLALVGTAFQKRVWQALLAIPHGKVVSYADVARAAGLTAGHDRAVGTAVGRNPISIIVACHRVLSASHTLAGYTGGLERKLALLRLEGHAVRPADAKAQT